MPRGARARDPASPVAVAIREPHEALCFSLSRVRPAAGHRAPRAARPICDDAAVALYWFVAVGE